MGVNRRDFLKLAAGGGVLLASAPSPGSAAVRKELPPEAVGILYDATLCIGCKSCMYNCKKYNSEKGGALFSENLKEPPYEYLQPEKIWDAPKDLSSNTLNIIKAYKSGSGMKKDAVDDGYSFVKRHCMHCVHAACVSACPVSALQKDANTGVVTYDKTACIGCRYCQVACPFNIPKFEWDEAFPQIRKCQLCNHRFKEGKYSACCEFCPTGASIFGKVVDLRNEAKRRLTLKAGDWADYPVQRVDGSQSFRQRVPTYVNHVYGMNEVGGTQYLLMAGVPFDRIGLPNLPEKAYAAVSEGLQHTLYWNMAAPVAVFAGLLVAAHRSTKDHE